MLYLIKKILLKVVNKLKIWSKNKNKIKFYWNPFLGMILLGPWKYFLSKIFYFKLVLYLEIYTLLLVKFGNLKSFQKTHVHQIFFKKLNVGSLVHIISVRKYKNFGQKVNLALEMIFFSVTALKSSLMRTYVRREMETLRRAFFIEVILKVNFRTNY